MNLGFRSVGMAIVAALLLAGCASAQFLAERSTNYNKAIEQAQNQTLLLNVLRARDRKPLYFTAMHQVRGNIRYGTGSGNVGIPFGGAATTDVYSASPSVSYATNPTFDITLLDSKEFYQGILKPVDMETIEYYVSQGWPKDILLHMFIRQIDIGDEEEIENYPGNPEEFDRFQRTLHRLELGVTKTSTTVPIKGPELTEETVQNLEHLLKARDAKLVVSKIPEKNRYQLEKTVAGLVFEAQGKENQMPVENATTKRLFATQMLDVEEKEKKGKVYIRSPEAMIYYLGELAREELKPGSTFKPTVRIGKTGKDILFRIEEVDPEHRDGYALVVEYGGSMYGIPAGSSGGRSMHVLSLITQILALHKSSKEFVGTQAVEVIGQ
jgi:hypothetical protein